MAPIYSGKELLSFQNPISFPNKNPATPKAYSVISVPQVKIFFFLTPS